MGELSKRSFPYKLGHYKLYACIKMLKSPKAFEQIEFVGCENVDSDIYYTRKMERERDARREYRKRKREKADIQELYIIDIMREEMTNGDARLSR